jgi:zinc protease
MKKLYTLLLAFLSVGLVAQIDRTKLPEPAPERPIQIGDYEQFELDNGLKVILVENNKLPRLSWTLSFSTGPITEGDKAGYSGIFGQVMSAGTTSKTKDEFNEEVEFMGAAVSAGATSVFASSLSKYKIEVLDLMTDLLFNPRFPEDEFERAIEQTLTGLKSAKDSPDAIAGNVRGVVNYGKDHPYGELVTEETVNNITMEDLKAHYAKFFKPNIAYLVIVGDIKTKEAKKLVEQYFGDWKSGEVQKEDFAKPQEVTETSIAFVDRPSSVQSVISISYPIDNKPGSDDAIKLSLLNRIFGGAGLSTRLNMNLREDKGYTYGANSSIGASRYSATFNAGASVRNEVTDSAMVQFFKEMQLISSELVTEEELAIAKSSAKGAFARSLESTSTIAQFALNTELNNLPEDYYSTYLQKIDAVTREDLLDVAKRYIRPSAANVVVVGKADEVADKLTQFGELTFYDDEANVVDRDAAKAAVASVDPFEVVEKYLEAVGGREAIANIEDITTVSTATLQGQTLTITSVQKGNIMSKQSVGMAGMVMQEMVFNNGAAIMKAQGQSQEIPPGAQLDAMKESAVIFPEQYYKEMKYELSVSGIQQVNGQEAYEVIIKGPDGSSQSQFFDVATGLLLREVDQNGDTVILEYKEVNGIKVPSKMTITVPGIGALEATVEVMINTGVEDTEFSMN